MLTQVESQMVNKILYHDWFPQIYLDMHQMGNRSARIFIPPFTDPINPNVNPMIWWETNLIGEIMGADLEAAGKTGVVTSAFFTAWWQGAFLMTAWSHNCAGLLTELASCRVATPIFQQISDMRAGGRGLSEYRPFINFPNPWKGGWWKLRDIVEYDKVCAYSLLETAAKFTEYNFLAVLLSITVSLRPLVIT